MLLAERFPHLISVRDLIFTVYGIRCGLRRRYCRTASSKVQLLDLSSSLLFETSPPSLSSETFSEIGMVAALHFGSLALLHGILSRANRG